jgi:hypothetical protein
MIQVFLNIAGMILSTKRLSKFGCRTLVGFKGAGFLIANSIFPLTDSKLAQMKPHPSQKS